MECGVFPVARAVYRQSGHLHAVHSDDWKTGAHTGDYRTHCGDDGSAVDAFGDSYAADHIAVWTNLSAEKTAADLWNLFSGRFYQQNFGEKRQVLYWKMREYQRRMGECAGGNLKLPVCSPVWYIGTEKEKDKEKKKKEKKNNEYEINNKKKNNKT